MAITPVSKEAFATLAVCEETRKTLAITIDPKGNKLNFIWAFKIDREKAHKERFDSRHVRGTINYDKNFPGCPHCQARDFYICGSCGSIVCWHGQKHVTCPSCGNKGEIKMVESISLKGGGL